MGSAPDFQTERSVAGLACHAGTGFNFTTRTIGPGGTYRNVVPGVWSLRAQRPFEFDVIHAWDACSVMAAAIARPGKVIFSPSEFPSRSLMPWIGSLTRLAGVHVVCSQDIERHIYLQNGIVPSRCHLLPYGLDFDETGGQRDESLRQSLGFTGNNIVLLAPGESTRRAGHRDAIWTASILHVLDPNYRLLLWGRGDQLASCKRLAEKLRQPNLLVVAESKLGRRVRFEELTGACDAVIHLPNGPTPPHALATCMAAGRPIVTARTPFVPEILKDRRNALIVGRRSATACGAGRVGIANGFSLATPNRQERRNGCNTIFQACAMDQRVRGFIPRGCTLPLVKPMHFLRRNGTLFDISLAVPYHSVHVRGGSDFQDTEHNR